MTFTSHRLAFPDKLAPALHPQLVAAGIEPLPTLDELAVLLEIAFYASLGRDERRPVRFAVVFIPLGLLLTRVADVWAPATFAQPRPFAVEEVVRLAPATDERQTSIAVSRAVDGSLCIFGLVRTNLDMHRLSEATAASASRLQAKCLRIHVREAASLTVSVLDHDFAVFVRGRLLGASADVFNSHGPVQSQIEMNTDSAFRAKPGITHLTYATAVTRVLLRMKELGHGGTLVLCSPDAAPALDIKYATRFADLREAFIADAKQNHEQLAAESAALQSGGDDSHPRAPDDDRARLWALAWNARFSRNPDRLRDAAAAVGDLASTDGALVLASDLTVFGFGAMFPSRETPPTAYLADASNATVRHVYDLTQYGARHRSAAAFANDNPGTIAFVLSEDGPLSCFLRPVVNDLPLLLWRPVSLSWLLRRPPSIRHLEPVTG